MTARPLPPRAISIPTKAAIVELSKNCDNSAMSITSEHFRALTALLPGDDPAEFNHLLEELHQHFKPADLIEIRQVREMADAEWRLRRMRQYSSIIIQHKIKELSATLPNLHPLELQARAHAECESSLAFFQRQEQQHQRQYDRAFSAFMRYQTHQRRMERTQGQSIVDQIHIQTEALVRASHQFAEEQEAKRAQQHQTQPQPQPQNRTSEPNHAQARAA